MRVSLTCAFILTASAGTAVAAVDFSSGVMFPAPNRPTICAVGDFDRDGDVDIAVTTDTPDRVSILRNNGAGVFESGANWGFNTGNGTGPQDIAAVDWDHDGDLDLVVVLQGIDTLRIYLNNGSGSFTASPVTANVGASAQGLAMADIDGDGDLDFAVVNRSVGTGTIITNNGSGFSSSTLAGGEDLRTSALADLNGDGRPEFAFTIHDERLLKIYTNNGSGGFGNPVTIFQGSQVRPEGVISADIDGDGDNDLLVTNSDDNPPFNFVTVWKNNGSGAFSGPFNYQTQGIDPGALLAEDLDGDGDLDVAVTNNTSATMALLTNNGAGALTLEHPLLATGGHPDFVGAGDFDGNGTPDLTVTNRDANTMSVYMNELAAVPACAADLGSAGGRSGPDGVLDNNDFIAFISEFFAADPRADKGVAGGVPGQDGRFDNNDFIAFIGLFFSGC